jgi:tripartite-type tricarboxylate transporter receptor subunit TctC
MKIMRLMGGLLLAATLAATPSVAQEFPKKQPIKIVVAANAGGGTDVLARITADFLQRRLGQAVIVENRPGAGAAIGVEYVAKSAPDGYTLLFIASELTVLPAVRHNLPYKFDELSYLVRAFAVHPIMLAGPKFPVNSVPELITYMKANPGKVRYGSTGVGAIVHLGMAAFEGAAGVKGTHIPYTGIAPVYTDMLAGNIEITEATPPFVDGLRVIGNVGSERNPLFPDVPTLTELGYKNGTWDIWFGVVGPPKLPKAISERLITEINAVMHDPEAIAKYQAAAKLTPEAKPLTGEDFHQSVLKEHEGWKVVVAREHIEVPQ